LDRRGNPAVALVTEIQEDPMSTVLLRLIAKFSLSPKPDVAEPQGRAVTTAMTGNANFPNASAQVAAAVAGLDDLQKLNAAAKTDGPSARKAAKAQLVTVRSLLDVLKGIVQQASDAVPNNGGAIILSAGMGIRKRPVRVSKGEIAVDWGTVSGMVLLYAACLGRASYAWQVSTDGKSWSPLPTTLKSRTTVHGLTPMTMYYFRVKPTTKAGEQDWSQTVDIMVK